jgi:hypothetical protein
MARPGRVQLVTVALTVPALVRRLSLAGGYF